MVLKVFFLRLAVLIVTILCWSEFVIAKPATNLKVEDLISAIEKIEKLQPVKIDLKKIETSEFLGTKEYSGALVIKNNQYRLDITQPAKSLITFDGKTFLSFQYPQSEGSPIQVLRSKLDEKTKNQMFLSYFVSKEKFNKAFSVLKVVPNKDLTSTFYLKPRDKSLQVTEFQAVVGRNTKTLKSIQHKDELGNSIEYKVKNMKKETGLSQDFFKAEIPKGAQVTDL